MSGACSRHYGPTGLEITQCPIILDKSTYCNGSRENGFSLYSLTTSNTFCFLHLSVQRLLNKDTPLSPQYLQHIKTLFVSQLDHKIPLRSSCAPHLVFRKYTWLQINPEEYLTMMCWSRASTILSCKATKSISKILLYIVGVKTNSLSLSAL